MKVDNNLWQQTSIGHVLDVFTGKISQKLLSASDKTIEQLLHHLPQLFRRWYFLRLSETEDLTPFDRLEYFKHLEKWPEQGQFLIKPSLNRENSTKKIEIVLDVDFISFMEQPLIADLNSTQSHYWASDRIYKNAIKIIQNSLHTDDRKSFELIWKEFIFFLCALWRDEDPFIKNAFSLDQLVDINQTFLKQAYLSKELGIGSDELIGAYVLAVRKIFPGWAYTIKELEEKERAGGFKKPPTGYFDKMKADTFYMLGINIDRFFLTPLTIYLNLISPYYFDLLCWEADLEQVLKNPKADSEIILSDPPSSFRLTKFGQNFVERFL